MIPNFIDDLNTKKVRIQVLYDPLGFTPSVKHPGGVKEDVIPGPAVNPEICFRDDLPTNTISGYFFEDWTCHPNPVNEVIWFDITGSDIIEIVVDTVSRDDPSVGGRRRYNFIACCRCSDECSLDDSSNSISNRYWNSYCKKVLEFR